ncbi:MAG: ComEC family competence protein [Paludibacteraceae bacterium]|nr:ComEC family competence protein [Paludibacteraceae bacterium]
MSYEDIRDKARAYPMVVLLLPVVAAILICNSIGPKSESLRHTPINLLYQTEYDALDSLRTYSFVLLGEPKHTARCERYEAQVMPHGRVLLYVLRDSTRLMPHAGDTLIAYTSIHRPSSIGKFDYYTYLRRQGIVGTAYVNLRYAKCNVCHSYKPSLQRKLHDRLVASGIVGDELAITSALTLGYKADLESTLRQRFQASGAAHVLAVSGLHTGIIYFILSALLTLCGRVKPRYENQLGRCVVSGIIIVVMWCYAWITGMTPSVVRAVLMLTLFEVAHMFYRQAFSVNTIAAAAVLILLVRPLNLWNVSFQLSFAATIAIVVMAKDLESLINKRELNRHWSGKIVSWILGIIIVSLAAQLGTLPISMYTFGQVSNYFLLTNILVLPLASLLVPCGLVTIALGGTSAGRLIGEITYWLAHLMSKAVGWVESLPGSVTNVRCSISMVILLYISIIMAWLAMHKSLWWLCGVVASLFMFCVMFTFV